MPLLVESSGIFRIITTAEPDGKRKYPEQQHDHGDSAKKCINKYYLYCSESIKNLYICSLNNL